jgi:predicted small lipoprotein YifL
MRDFCRPRDLLSCGGSGGAAVDQSPDQDTLRVAFSRTLGTIAARGALVAALAATLALAGCGRKGGLDAPPMAAAGDQAAPQPAQGAAYGPDGRPIAPATTTDKRHTLFDWLID